MRNQPPFSIFLCFLSALFLCTGALQAAVPPDFNAANNLYANGEFKGARAAYESLVKAGPWSANLFFNLGNADYRLGDKGAAFLAYERALALEPGHPEAKANLQLLRDETGARLPELSWKAQLLSWPQGNLAAWLAALAFWTLCFSLLPALFKRRAAWGLALVSAGVLAWCGAALAWRQSQGELWIAIAPQTQARLAPADTSELTASLPMGSHVRLLYERGPWLYVQLPDQKTRGWLPRASVEPVAPKS